MLCCVVAPSGLSFSRCSAVCVLQSSHCLCRSYQDVTESIQCNGARKVHIADGGRKGPIWCRVRNSVSCFLWLMACFWGIIVVEIYLEGIIGRNPYIMLRDQETLIGSEDTSPREAALQEVILMCLARRVGVSFLSSASVGHFTFPFLFSGQLCHWLSLRLWIEGRHKERRWTEIFFK